MDVKQEIKVAHEAYKKWLELCGFEDTDGRRQDYTFWSIAHLMQRHVRDQQMEAAFMDMVETMTTPAANEAPL